MKKQTAPIPSYQIVERGLIKTEHDVLRLGIIDWNRVNGYWGNPSAAIKCISSWLINLAHYEIADVDMRRSPIRSDWPGWDHVGTHEILGQFYWNWFHENHTGEILFSDEPDFTGTLNFGNETAYFTGDVGLVSASTFALEYKFLEAHDLWISVTNHHRQVIIEPLVTLSEAQEYVNREMAKTAKVKPISLFHQPLLFE